MKGYKGMESDMTCRGFQYEIGKTYLADGDIKLCKNGFHFCKNLEDVFEYYGNDRGNRFFEVEGNVIKSDRKKSVANKIHIIRELTKKEVNRCHCSNHTGNGCCGNECGYGFGYNYGDGDNSEGHGNGNGFGGYYANGEFYCYGNINGNGCGDGNGDGYGYGYGFKDYNLENLLKFI